MNRSTAWTRIALVCLLATGATATFTRAAEEPRAAATTKPVRLERPVPQIERAVLISIDGARPDVLLRAKTPNLRKLIESGSYSFWAKTVPAAVTLPSHASMMTGVLPERHGITFNGRQKDAEVARPKVPTLFEIAMRYGMTTAVIAGKSKFDTFAQVGRVGKSWTKSAKDADVARAAVEMIEDYRPDVMLIHFPGADGAGHAAGWGSPEQVAALENIDAQLGKVVAAIDDAGLREETVILVTSDHGGAGRGHGTSSGGLASPDDPRSQHIPWILVGPGIRKGYDLSQDPTLQIRTMDSFATLCHLLGLQVDGHIDGKPIVGAIEQRGQLLEEAK